jgi:hypothetical protein
MAFFKKYNGTTNVRLLRLERITWILIYGGLLSMVLAHFAAQEGAAGNGALFAIGLLAALAGVGLIVLRSRMREEDL